MKTFEEVVGSSGRFCVKGDGVRIGFFKMEICNFFVLEFSKVFLK